jgi:hypothetical protein
MKYRWNEFLEEGGEMFEYMTQNFDTMIDEDFTIKHFTIRHGIFNETENVIKIRKKYGEDIQKNLIAWIQTEFKSGRLFDKSLWKPVRVSGDITDMFLGYRYFFSYKKYHFQLALYYVCMEYIFCKCCNYSENDNLNIHFELALYDWKNDKLQPDKNLCISSDNLIPNFYWSRE